MQSETKAPGRCSGRGADRENASERIDRVTSRRVRQGIIRLTGGVIVAAGAKFIAFRAGPAGLAQVGAIADSFGAALAAISGGR